MNYEEERESMLRKGTPTGAALLSNEEDCDVIRRQRNPTNNNHSSGICTGNVKFVNIAKLETDLVGDKQNGICDNSSKKSLKSMSRYTESLEEFVQKELSFSRKNDALSPEPTLKHSMNMELIRLGSFHNFPSSKAVSTLRLSHQGFYYSIEHDVTICFACGCRKRGWRSDDIIEVVHRNMSPDCPLLSSQPTSNIQIGNDQKIVHCIIELEQHLNASGHDFPSSSNRQPSSPTSEVVSSGNEIEIEPNTNSKDKKGSDKTPSSHKTLNDLLTRTRTQQDKINAFIWNLDPLGINFDRPKYPSYSVRAVRVSSFADWPSSLSQTPRDLAVAGFLYAGYGDYTRCFFCGGGLRNWEPGDDPWTEHARWFPKCAFVRQNKGDEFVALVQIHHQELEAMGAPNENLAGDQATGPENVVSGRLSEPDVYSLPALQSVLEMGYPSHVIQQAFDFLKNKKECIDIKAEEVMDAILFGDDIPPSSVAKTPDNAKDITAMSYEDSINSNEQQTKSSLLVATKESAEADTRSLIEDNRHLKDLMMCKICMEKDAYIAMLPCGHLCCCTECAPAMRKCPICRHFVKGTVRTWLA